MGKNTACKMKTRTKPNFYFPSDRERVRQNLSPNFHILIVKYVGITNSSPAMVKIISERFKQSVKIPFSNDPGDSIPDVVSAEKWLQEKGFKIVGHGQGKGHMYVITETFKPLKSEK